MAIQQLPMLQQRSLHRVTMVFKIQIKKEQTFLIAVKFNKLLKMFFTFLVICKKERQMKLTRFIFSRRFEVIVTPLSSDKYLQVLEFK